MDGLSHNELEVIVGCCFPCGESKEKTDAVDLIQSNPNAFFCYNRLRELLGRIQHLPCEPCPDTLADLTIARLKLTAGVL